MQTRVRSIIALLATSGCLLAAGPAAAQTTDLDLYEEATLDEAEPLESEPSQPQGDLLGLIAEAMPGVAAVEYRVKTAHGQSTETRWASGFLLSDEGHFITTDIRDAVSITVHCDKGQSAEARLVGTDPLLGVGLLKLEGELPLEPIPMGSAFEVTERQVAISLQKARGTGATVGYIAGITAASGGLVHLVTSATLPTGSLGGPLLDMEGQALGVIVSLPEAGQTRAVPIDLLRPVIEQLKAGEPIQRSSMGIKVQKLDDALARSYGVPVDGGVAVGEIEAEGPADGILKPGDLIKRLAGASVDDPTDIDMIVGSTRPGTALKVDIQRAGADKTVTVQVGARSDADGGASKTEPTGVPDGPQLTADLEPMTPELAEKMGHKQAEGVLIADLPKDSPVGDALAKGDVILDVAGISVGSPEEMRTALARQPADKPVRLVVLRDGTVQLVAVEFGE